MKTSTHLRRYRKARRLSQQEVARRLGLKNHSLISRWERGCSLPNLTNAFRLAHIYKVTVRELFAHATETPRFTARFGPRGRAMVHETAKEASDSQ